MGLLERSSGKHNTDIIRTSLVIKISSSLEDWHSSLFHVTTGRCFSKKNFQFLRRVFYLCKKSHLAKKHFPLGYESMEVEFILLLCYININSMKCLGVFSHIKLVFKRSEKFHCDWCREMAMHISQGKLPNTKYLKCLNIFIKIGTNRISSLKKKSLTSEKKSPALIPRTAIDHSVPGSHLEI